MAVCVPAGNGYSGGGRELSASELLRKLTAGELEMAQISAAVLGTLCPQLWLLDLPFLFESYEHAAAVLDGSIGRELLGMLLPSGLRGLAFAYGGGYRVISTTRRRIRCGADMQGIRVRVEPSPVTRTFFESLGAQPVVVPPVEIARLTRDGRLHGAELSWCGYWEMVQRAVQPIVNETEHSLGTSLYVVNDRWYRGLAPSLRRVLERAAIEAAQLERAQAVAHAVVARQSHIRAGGEVVRLSYEARRQFERAGVSCYERYVPLFGDTLMERVRTANYQATHRLPLQRLQPHL